MSDGSQNYQVNVDTTATETTTESISNAMEEKFQEQTAAQTLHSSDIEAEGSETEELTEVAEPADDKFDSKFAALSRKEKAIRDRESQMEDKIAQFEARMAQFEEAQNPQEPAPAPEVPLEQRLRKNPLQTLEEMGYSYEDLTKMVLNDGQMSTDMQMKLMKEELERDYSTKFEELNNKLTEKEQAEEESKYNEAIDGFKADINDFVSSNEKYELIQANDAVELVYDVIEEYYKENGRILDTAEAADQIEQYLEEEVDKLFEKSNKLRSRLNNANQPVASAPRQSPTLSNSHAVTSKNPTTGKLLTREESLAQLAPLIKWED